MPFVRFVAISACIVFVVNCGRRGNKAQQGDRDRIDLTQNVTRNPRAEDIIFKNFKDNWRQFISKSPELALPVTRPTQEPAWQPLVTAECVSSADAHGLVPQVTLSWNEPAGQESSKIRFDLVLHHNGFARNYFSTALATDKLKRFNLPSNSGLIKDQEALLLTGPGLFPKLMDFRTEPLEDSGAGRRFQKLTLILRDLAPGLTYTIRMCRLAGKEWEEEKQFVFLTPVCPNSF